MTVSNGTWSNSPTSYSYQWQDCNSTGGSCTAISGATGSTYLLEGSDAGHTIRAQVTATNSGGSAAASSTQTGVVGGLARVNSVLPAMSGSAVEGQSLKASNGTWSGSPTSFAYQWQDCDSSGAARTAISGATSSSYTLGGADTGHAVRVTVVAQNAAGTGEATSTQTGVVGAKSSTCTVELSSIDKRQRGPRKRPGRSSASPQALHGHLELTAGPASTATLTAAPGAHVVIEGLKLKENEASHLTIRQIHFHGGIEPYKTNHDKIEYVEITQKAAGEDGFYCWDCKQVELRHSIIKHFESAGGDADLTHFKEETEEVTVAENEFTEAYDIEGAAGHMDTLQTEGKAGFKAGKLTFEKNYIHDIWTQGTPFLQQENAEVNGEPVIKDNLVVRNNVNACKNALTEYGKTKTCAAAVANIAFYISDKYENLHAENNVQLETSGGAIEADSGQKVFFNHNVFDLMKREAGGEGANTVAEYNYIASLGGYQSASRRKCDGDGAA